MTKVGVARDQAVIIAATSSDAAIGAEVLEAEPEPAESLKAVNARVLDLKQRYPMLGGVAGYQYFNATPAGRPWEWPRQISKALHTPPPPLVETALAPVPLDDFHGAL